VAAIARVDYRCARVGACGAIILAHPHAPDVARAKSKSKVSRFAVTNLGPHCKAVTQPASHLQKQKSQVAFLLRVLFRPTRPPSPVVPSSALRCVPPKTGGPHSAPYCRAPQLGSGPCRPRGLPFGRFARSLQPAPLHAALPSVAGFSPTARPKNKGKRAGLPQLQNQFHQQPQQQRQNQTQRQRHVRPFRSHWRECRTGRTSRFAPSLQLVRLCTWPLCRLQCPLARASGQRQPQPPTGPHAGHGARAKATPKALGMDVGQNHRGAIVPGARAKKLSRGSRR